MFILGKSEAMCACFKFLSAPHAPCNSLSFEVQPPKSTNPYLEGSSPSQGLFETAKADSMHKPCGPRIGWFVAASPMPSLLHYPSCPIISDPKGVS
ncbi:hypothetical protein VNO77_31257 [Canavalia gladiata]|uniref:Uncharacterized protein n=1 Tax=Canavalia gladiata TaxID=3824 RepID=A0AAN9Q1Q1_CANGL